MDAAPPADRLVLLDGSVVVSDVTAIKPDGTVVTAARTLALPNLRRIDRPVTITPDTLAAVLVHLVGGGVLRARSATIANNHCTLDGPIVGMLALPLTAVRALVFTARYDSVSNDDHTLARQLADPNLALDQLLVVIDGQVQSVGGAVQAVTTDHVAFQWSGKTRTTALDKVLGVVLARTGKPVDLTGKALLHLVDGSTLWAAVHSLAAGKLTVQPVGADATLVLPWNKVARLDVRSARMVFLSDLTPTDVQQQALAYVGPWRRDTSVRGAPLTLGGRVFAKGLGVHATTSLTYAVAGRYDTFAATIGIDDETHGRGDCVFIVRGDGKELFRKRMRADDAPLPVHVAITGAQHVTLVVEPGADGDFADHGDWADARFIHGSGQ